MNQTKEFFKSIEKSEVQEVNKFLKTNRLKQIYDGHNVSAVMTSLKVLFDIEQEIQNSIDNDKEIDRLGFLKKRQILIHESLVERGLRFGPHENSSSLVDSLEIMTKIKLKKIHKILTITSMKHVTSLISMSKLSHNAKEKDFKELRQRITTAFEELNDIKPIEPILRVVANFENLDIFFDFGYDKVHNFDSTLDEYTYGAAFPEHREVKVGAKKLLKKKSRNEVLGHLVHELLHIAMEMIYRNTGKPYNKHSENKDRFQEILKSCEEKKSEEEIIRHAFDGYKHSKRHAELIARVPHLLAYYVDNEERLRKVQSTFSELFRFYEEKTMVDLQREYPLMESKRKLQDLNNLNGVETELKTSKYSFKEEVLKLRFNESEITFCSSNCVELSMRLIFQQMSADEKVIFASFDSLMSKKKINLIVNAFKSINNVMIVIDCDKQKTEDIKKLLNKLLNENVSERVAIVHSNSLKFPEETSIPLNHSWNQLTELSQKSLLKSPVLLQGKRILLEDVLPFNSSVLDFLSLHNLIEGKVVIGEEIIYQQPQSYIERDFTYSASQPSLFKSKNTKLITESSEKLSADVLIEKAEDQKIILLSNDPGFGKTLELQMMAKRIKNRQNSLFVLFVVMRNFVEIYEKEGKITKTFSTRSEIDDFFCKKILKFTRFEEQVFAHLFNENRIVFLFDGLDEICPTYKQFNLNWISAIRTQTENQVWITTRPHVTKELENVLRCSAFRLQHIFKTGDLVRKVFEEKGFDDEELRQLIQKANDFAVNLKMHSKVKLQFDNPILIKTIATVVRDDEEGILNAYSVYKNFALRIMRHFLAKGSEAYNEVVGFFMNSVDIMAFHQRKAIEVLFEDNDEDTRKEVQACFEGAFDLPVEQMARVGFMLAREHNQLEFGHQHFIEFAVADFFERNLFKVKVVDDKRSKAIMSLFRLIWLSTNNFESVKIFFDGAFEIFLKENPSKSRKVKRIFKINFSLIELRTIFHDSVRSSLINVIRTLPLDDSSIDKKDLESLWIGSSDEIRKFDEEDDDFIQSMINKLVSAMNQHLPATRDINRVSLLRQKNDKNVLMIAAREQSLNFIKELLSLAFNTLGSEIIEKMFQEQNETGETALMYATHNRDSDVFEYLFNHPQLSRLDRKNNILHEGKERNLLMSACVETSTTDLILDTVEQEFDDKEIKQLLTYLNIRGDTVLLLTLMGKNATTFGRISKLLFDKLSPDELKMIAGEKGISDHTPLIATASLKDENFFQAAWNFLKNAIGHADDFKQQLIHETKSGHTVFHSATNNENVKNFNFIKNVYENNFSEEEMKEIFLKRYPSDIMNGSNIVFYYLATAGQNETTNAVWLYVQRLLTDEEIAELVKLAKS